MYQYVRNPDFLAGSYSHCANLVNQLVQHLRKYDITAKMTTIGNRKRGLVVRNDNEPVHYEFYLLLQNAGHFRPYDLKEQVMNAFNEILDRNWLPNCVDTPYGILTKPMQLSGGDRSRYVLNLTLISVEEDGTWQQLRHFKTEHIIFDEWYWCPVPYSKDMTEMEYCLKPQHSLRIRRAYLEQKDSCLDRAGYACPSLTCYLNVLHQIYEWALEKEKEQSNDCP